MPKSRTRHLENPQRAAMEIAAIYAVVGGLWITYSDRALELVAGSVERLTALQTYKGWFFVIFTSLVLFYFVRNRFVENARAHQKTIRYADDLERRVAKRTEQLAAAKERAEGADRLKSVFLATMSHELRTPLNSIIGFSGMLQSGLAGPINDEQVKQLGMIRDSSRHLLDLVNDILDISKIEAGQLQVESEIFIVGDVVTEAVEFVRPLAGRKALALEVDLPEDLGVLHSDRRRVRQILINLLSNAVKFTPTGKISVRAKADGDWLRVTVADTGVGIDAADLDEIFRPFSSVKAHLAETPEGTGLGLSISQRLAKRLGGELGVTSTLGTGSEFTMSLPYIPTHAETR